MHTPPHCTEPQNSSGTCLFLTRLPPGPNPGLMVSFLPPNHLWFVTQGLRGIVNVCVCVLESRSRGRIGRAEGDSRTKEVQVQLWQSLLLPMQWPGTQALVEFWLCFLPAVWPWAININSVNPLYALTAQVTYG